MYCPPCADQAGELHRVCLLARHEMLPFSPFSCTAKLSCCPHTFPSVHTTVPTHPLCT